MVYLGGLNGYFKKYRRRHWVHAKETPQQRQQEEKEEKAEEETEEQEEKQAQDQHIDAYNVERKIDFYYHVNGVKCPIRNFIGYVF